MNTLPITRVDMHENARGVLVQQFEDGWMATTAPIEKHLNASESLVGMIAWFRAHGWTVREWPGGARAFKGPALPVRTKLEIQRLRRQLTCGMIEHQGQLPRGIQAHTLDLAVDL